MNGSFSGLKGDKACFLLLAGFAFYFLFSLFHPFLHNHVVDGNMHDDCEVCLWVVVSAGVLIFLMGLCLLLKVLSRQEESFRPVFIPGADSPPSSRSPPPG